MGQIDMRDAMAAAIGRSGRQHKDIAAVLGITPQNLSNVLNDRKREVPTKWLEALARDLDDIDFKMIVADEILDFGLYSPSRSVNYPLAKKTMMDKEQADREKLDTEIAMILCKPIDEISADDRSLIGNFLKELKEEISSEISYKGALEKYLKQKVVYHKQSY